MNNPDKWLDWARRIQAIAQNQLEYSHSEYDIERGHKLTKIASEIIEQHTGQNSDEICEIYLDQKGYSTPRVDVRAAVIRDGLLLLVKESSDGKWAMPGGWMDVGDKPAEAAVREAYEESGFNVKVEKVIGVYDANRITRPLNLFHAVKIVYLCSIVDGKATTSFETTEVKFFDIDNLPELSPNRTNEQHIADIKAVLKNPEIPTVFE